MSQLHNITDANGMRKFMTKVNSRIGEQRKPVCMRSLFGPAETVPKSCSYLGKLPITWSSRCALMSTVCLRLG